MTGGETEEESGGRADEEPAKNPKKDPLRGCWESPVLCTGCCWSCLLHADASNFVGTEERLQVDHHLNRPD